jgi:hypothetical protein
MGLVVLGTLGVAVLAALTTVGGRFGFFASLLPRFPLPISFS